MSSEEAWFPGRSIKPYSVPITPGELKIGDIYFRVVFLDSAGKVPEWLTLVFVEKIDEDGKGPIYCFQDAGSFHDGFRHTDDDAAGEVSLHYFEETGINGIYCFEEALDIMLEVSLRRSGDSE